MTASTSIQFKNPVGLNMERFATVRVGTKWQERLQVGAEVDLVDSTNSDQGTAVVRDIWAGQLCRVPASLIEIAHDPISRTYSGLRAVLAITYGKTIGHQEFVNVLVLEPSRSTTPIAGAPGGPEGERVG